MPPELTPESPTNASSSNATVRMALGVSYNGQGYNGWQSQLSGNTVQDKLEAALGRFATHTVSTLCAGRTDSGVHGLMQVVHFDTPPAPPQRIVGSGHQHLFATRHCGAMGTAGA